MAGYRVGEVSRLAHLSVRTLHHYDEVGLLRPSGRSVAGYRLYSAQDLVKLQQILLYRECGFGLRAIADIMAGPLFDRREALLAQRGLVAERSRRLSAMLGLIDKTLANMEGGAPMSADEMFEVFGDFDPAQYEPEVKERWGDTEAYRESARRTAGYTREDWQRFKTESEEITLAIAALMDEGVSPDDERAMEAVERHRVQIDHWFYPCSHQMHRNLGEMYVADPRFTATYERIRPGMAEYVRDAIAANAERAAGPG